MQESINIVETYLNASLFILLYMTIIIYVITRYFHEKKENIELKILKEKIQKMDNIKRAKLKSKFEYIALQQIKNQTTKEIMSKETYYIDEYLDEPLSMYIDLNTGFIKAIGEILVLYTKANSYINKSVEEIDAVLDSISNELDVLLYTAQTGVNKVKNVIIEKKPIDIIEITKKKLIDKSIMDLYTATISNLQEQCDTFGKLEWYFSDNILKKQPSLKPKSDVISMKLMYFFYLDINECIKLLDEHIYITKVIEQIDQIESMEVDINE